MALTSFQLPSYQEFRAQIQNAATKINDLVNTWRDISEFVGRMDTSDLDAMGVPTGQIRTDLNNFRTLLDELVSFMEGNAVTPSNIPEDIIEVLRFFR